MTNTAEFWNTVYDNDTAPWVIGRPQPQIVQLEQDGLIRGRVLDPGTGAGEHTILLTERGYDVLGVDLSPSAVAYAQRNAAEKGVPSARFQVADMVRVGTEPGIIAEADGTPLTFDTIIDSALFHVFGAGEDQAAIAAYVRSLHALLVPGGHLHVLALSTAEEGFGPRIGESVIRDAFATGWEIEDLRPSTYLGRVTDLLPQEELAQVTVAEDGIVEAAAWLVRLRRL
ncbi:class I SAM-dependent methyltransferase [Nocardia callitridis]|uniref:Class I SAM-dependent methyltransferase n=1 Tax=Nocardia callitridis TaxID=648753 RepID=A0ABP9KRT4_9NOCA